MRIPLVPATIIIIIGIIADAYIYFRINRNARVGNTSIRWRSVQLFTAILCDLVMVCAVCMPRKSGSDATLISIMWLLYAYLTVYLPKYIFIVIDLLGAFPMLVRRKRVKAFTAAGVILAVVCFGLMWWGALVNRFNIQHTEVHIAVKGLPDEFDGYRIAQISDLHTGTYGSDTSYLHKVVEEINSLGADAIVFTGDIVNRRSDELIPHAATLSHLKAPDGVYSILGNHDYGDYSTWPSAQAKEENLQLLKDLQKEMGWKLLLNETSWLHRGNDSIAMIGVENIGDPPFKSYGDLEASYPGNLSDSTAKILLSHNPMHWVYDIRDNKELNIPVTLSGHTHAMQMELFGWSPAEFRYPTWAGLYKDSDETHRLYVNIGIGSVGLPMRIGATPEITSIVLHKAD